MVTDTPDIKLTSSPGPLGWIFGGFSLGLAIAVIGGVAILSDRAHDALTIKSVSARVSSGNIREQDLARELDRKGTPFSEWVYNTIFGIPISAAPAPLNHLVRSFWGVQNGKMDSAWSNFEDAIKESDALVNRKPDFGRRLFSLKSAFQAYNISAEEYANKQSESTRLTELQQKLRMEYLATRDELVGLFGLEPQPFGEEQQPTFYDEGILAGLPELPGIGDAIANFSVLKDTIKNAGGSVAAFTENTNSEIQETLGALSDTSLALKETITETSNSLSELTHSVSELAEKKGSIKDSLAQDIEETINFGVNALEDFDLEEILAP